MRVFKIWDVEEKKYAVRNASGVAPQSTWDKQSSAKKVAGRICNKYEIHCFTLDRCYEESV